MSASLRQEVASQNADAIRYCQRIIPQIQTLRGLPRCALITKKSKPLGSWFLKRGVIYLQALSKPRIRFAEKGYVENNDVKPMDEINPVQFQNLIV